MVNLKSSKHLNLTAQIIL